MSTVNSVIKSIWPMIAIFVVSIGLVRICYISSRKTKFVFHEEFMSLVFLVYLLLLFELVTNTEIGVKGINLVPFTEIFRYEVGSNLFWQNVMGNVIVFIPFGFFVSNYLKNGKFWTPVFITLATSAVIELVQYKIGRAMDIDDIILNVLGGLLGYLLFIILKAIKSKLPKFMKSDGFLSFVCVLITLLITYYVLVYLGIWWF